MITLYTILTLICIIWWVSKIKRAAKNEEYIIDPNEVEDVFLVIVTIVFAIYSIILCLAFLP